jgi:hypothetical protein
MFAEYLGCKSVFEIHYDNIDVDVDELTSDDIEDFQNNGFVHYTEILAGYKNDGKIPYELLEQYSLNGLGSNDIDTNDLEFPTHPIKNLARLKEYIESKELNEISLKTVTRDERMPQYSYDKNGYVLREYACDEVHGLHFCQICKEAIIKTYVEVNAIEYEPNYAWEQMQLCLCLTCSKDFESLRHNEVYRKNFMRALSEADINDEEPIVVTIGDKDVHFTATHLAEVQEIIRKQNRTKDSK